MNLPDINLTDLTDCNVFMQFLIKKKNLNLHENVNPELQKNVEAWHNVIAYSVIGLKYNHVLKLIDGLKLDWNKAIHKILSFA
jgi:hypothetical protein